MAASKLVQILQLLKAIRELSGLTRPEKLLLFVLASVGDPDGTNIHPGHTYLATCLMTDERTVRRHFKSLEDKGYVEEDGKLKYVKRYRLNIPGTTIKALTTPDISQEEWESMMIPEEANSAVTESPSPHTILEDDEQPTDKLPVVRPQDDDATVKTPIVRPPNIPNTPTPEDKRRKDLATLWEFIDLARRGRAPMIYTYERFLQYGHRKGIDDDYLDRMWNYDPGGGETGSLGSQPEREPESSITNIPSGMYQP